ncbi:DUF1713 domain-containing protein [Caerostris darwini]|uniref:DUF1713 domain-containing protein n=1 Tax=Caerostris darwini TaxID=1538125 RepID=A0AAV4R8L2_9ARAC|nr:DUF1713 domain-containing protein [Caerostris darwini]
MAFRQVLSRCSKPLRSYLPVLKLDKALILTNNSPRCIDSISKCGWNFSMKNKLDSTSSFTLLNQEQNVSPFQITQYIDLNHNNLNKKFYMPTNTVNRLKFYEDINTINISINENLIKSKIILPAPPSQKITRKEAVRMILIRKRKMRKHKLRKLRKRMKVVFEKIKFKRELRKEQEFRTELLTQVEAADKFDAKEYVQQVLHSIRYQPKLETREEKKERLRILRRNNRYQTAIVPPNFDY